jgi:hypothetical protein
LLFLYKEVLGVELPWLDGIQYAKALVRLPVAQPSSGLTASHASVQYVRVDHCSSRQLLAFGPAGRALVFLEVATSVGRHAAAATRASQSSSSASAMG